MKKTKVKKVALSKRKILLVLTEKAHKFYDKEALKHAIPTGTYLRQLLEAGMMVKS